MITRPLHGLRKALGPVGLASLALIAGGMLFLFFVLKPLEARREFLDQRFAGSARSNSSGGASAAQAAAKLAALYQHLETREQTTDLLARLHAIGAAAGVELRTGDYRMGKGGGRIERYEITLPVAGSYAQIRTFLARALAEIPMLSLDQLNFRKQRPDEALVQAEMRLTLHLVRP